jgi:hypothetical protein
MTSAQFDMCFSTLTTTALQYSLALANVESGDRRPCRCHRSAFANVT